MFGNTFIGKPAEIIKPEPITIPMIATAYDLSIRCTGKSYNHPSRGITRSGLNLNGISGQDAMIVASTKYPISTKLKLTFPEGYEKYNGVYEVHDRGNFNENVLDVYVGDFGEQAGKETVDFGRVNVQAEIIE